MKTLFFAVLVAFFSVGCASSRLPTVSGKAEATVPRNEMERYRERLMNRWASIGYIPARNDALQLVMDRQSTSATQDVLMGSMYDPFTFHRIRVTFIPNGDEVRAIGQIYVVANRASAFERQTELGGVAAQQVQNALSVEASLLSRPTPKPATVTEALPADQARQAQEMLKNGLKP